MSSCNNSFWEGFEKKAGSLSIKRGLRLQRVADNLRKSQKDIVNKIPRNPVGFDLEDVTSLLSDLKTKEGILRGKTHVILKGKHKLS